jgi:hypothetical protein
MAEQNNIEMAMSLGVPVAYGTVRCGTVRKATVPYYLKSVRDPVRPVPFLKIFLTARCETVKSHVLKRKYRTISLLRRGLSLFLCKTPNQPLLGVPYYEFQYVTKKSVEVIER